MKLLGFRDEGGDLVHFGTLTTRIDIRWASRRNIRKPLEHTAKKKGRCYTTIHHLSCQVTFIPGQNTSKFRHLSQSALVLATTHRHHVRGIMAADPPRAAISSWRPIRTLLVFTLYSISSNHAGMERDRRDDGMITGFIDIWDMEGLLGLSLWFSL